MIRTYARTFGILLLLIGLWGSSGVIGPATNFYHMVVGAFFVYLGFLQRDTEIVRQVVGGIGVLLVFAMGSAVVVLLLLSENLLLVLLEPIEVVYLVLGISSILAAKYLPSSTATTWGFRKKGTP
jgi:hypothetical protein